MIGSSASATKSALLADLAGTKRQPEESVLNYITRWRNLSLNCALDQTQAVGLLMGNIDNWMAPFLRSSDIFTFEQLANKVAGLEKTRDPNIFADPRPPRPTKKEEGKKSENSKNVSATFAQSSDKGKKPMASAAVEKAPPAKKPVFGEGEDEPKRPIETL